MDVNRVGLSDGVGGGDLRDSSGGESHASEESDDEELHDGETVSCSEIIKYEKEMERERERERGATHI